MTGTPGFAVDRRWRCWVNGYPGNGEQVFLAPTASKARGHAFGLMHELGWPVKFTDVRCALEREPAAEQRGEEK